MYKNTMDLKFINEMTKGDMMDLLDRNEADYIMDMEKQTKRKTKMDKDLSLLKDKVDGVFTTPERPVLGTNGLVQYGSFAGAPGSESISEREERGRYWNSLGKKIRKGARV